MASEHDKQLCMICTTAHVDTTLPCSHRFCLACVREWTTVKKEANEPLTCPMCRSVFEEIPEPSRENPVPEVSGEEIKQWTQLFCNGSREEKRIAKDKLVQHMQDQKITYIQVQERFLILKERRVCPTLTVDRVKLIYFTWLQQEEYRLVFENNQQKATAFEEFVRWWQRAGSKKTYSLLLTKRAPIEHVLSQINQISEW